MPYILTSAQPHGYEGRFYLECSYHHDDGSNFIALVLEVQKGETEINPEEFQKQREANHEYNIAYEPKRVAAHRVAIDSAKDITDAMKAEAHASLDAQLAKADEWEHPKGSTVDHDLALINYAIAGNVEVSAVADVIGTEVVQTELLKRYAAIAEDAKEG